jgi:3-hydroxyisobutyrate dehydrogenase-like beta-hydroxyacid dehydrogenase
MKVGFIGLGNMGNPMAMNVLKAGHSLTVYDLRRETGRNLEEAGAQWAASPQDVAAQSEVVLSSLPGPPEVEAAVLGEQGIFAGLRQGAAYIDMSTNSPTTMRKIAEVGAARGVRILDAPVTGGVPRARDATLTILVGGEKADFNYFQPLLSTIGKHVFHMGPIGCGNVTKLVNNMMAFINFLGACEGLAIGAKAGVDPQTLLDAIKVGSGNSLIMEFGMQSFLKGEASLGFATALAAKDVHLAVELGKEVGVPIEVGPLVEAAITRFRDAGHGQDDILAIVRDFIQRSGVQLASKK